MYDVTGNWRVNLQSKYAYCRVGISSLNISVNMLTICIILFGILFNDIIKKNFHKIIQVLKIRDKSFKGAFTTPLRSAFPSTWGAHRL